MKKFKVLGFVIGFLLIFFIGFYIYYQNNFENNLKSDELNQIISEIQHSKNLPPNFYKTYEILKPNSLKNDLIMATLNKTECQSLEVARRIYYAVRKNHQSRIKNLLFEYFLTKKIEKNTTQKQCLDWTTRNFNFLYKTKGIENASNFYFKKNLENLNENEMEILVKMLDNPVKNNPLRKKNFR